MNRIIAAAILINTLVISFTAATETTVQLYLVNPDHLSDKLVSGTVENQPITFEYQYTYHNDYKGMRDFRANFIRFTVDENRQSNGTAPYQIQPID